MNVRRSVPSSEPTGEKSLIGCTAWVEMPKFDSCHMPTTDDDCSSRRLEADADCVRLKPFTGSEMPAPVPRLTCSGSPFAVLVPSLSTSITALVVLQVSDQIAKKSDADVPSSGNCREATAAKSGRLRKMVSNSVIAVLNAQERLSVVSLSLIHI